MLNSFCKKKTNKKNINIDKIHILEEATGCDLEKEELLKMAILKVTM